jgi:hypothetical protein
MCVCMCARAEGEGKLPRGVPAGASGESTLIPRFRSRLFLSAPSALRSASCRSMFRASMSVLVSSSVLPPCVCHYKATLRCHPTCIQRRAKSCALRLLNYIDYHPNSCCIARDSTMHTQRLRGSEQLGEQVCQFHESSFLASIALVRVPLLPQGKRPTGHVFLAFQASLLAARAWRERQAKLRHTNMRRLASLRSIHEYASRRSPLFCTTRGSRPLWVNQYLPAPGQARAKSA